MIFNRELSLVYDASGRSLAEFLIQINEDRPGILAAIGNAYADHGVNIINISYNRNQKMIHIIADMSGSDMGMGGELEELLKKFSFVSGGVVEKPLESNAHLIPSLSLPTFWGGRRVVVIDMDMLVSIGAPIFKIVQEMGRLDRSRLSDISPQMLRLVQLRGLARIDLVVVGSTVRAKLCNEDGLDLAMNYLEGLLGGEIPYRVYKSKESEACVELEISKL